MIRYGEQCGSECVDGRSLYNEPGRLKGSKFSFLDEMGVAGRGVQV